MILTASHWLWLIALVPLVFAARLISRTNFNLRQHWLQATVRSLLIAALAFALARPVAPLGASGRAVVYVVDVSHSVSTQAVADAASRINELESGASPDRSRIVAFGGNVAVFDSTARLLEHFGPDAKADQPATVDQDTSDVEHALDAARAELPSGMSPQIVLFSDGRETAGRIADAVSRLAAGGVRVSVEPMRERQIADTWIESVDAPSRILAGGSSTITVNVASSTGGAARVDLADGERIVATKNVTLAQGSTPVALPAKFDDPGARLVEATVTIGGDPLPPNNRLGREILVSPKPKVLYVEGVPASAHYLAGALDQAGFDVSAGGPATLPKDEAGLAPWDAVILSDTARASIPDSSIAALASWVEHDGGGLLVAGGESVFGESSGSGPTGYRHSEIERVMPVTFERKDEPEVALIIILDKSWSMAGQQMDLCKSAAQAAVDVLTDDQLLGVITFNDELNWDVTVRNVGKNRADIHKAIAAIEPSGHTLIYPAVEQAYLALKNVRAKAKHVVLLSDGRSYPDDYEGLVKKMVDAKITVSSIAVGPAADVELLTNIANWGKGRSYVVPDAKEVPQIFVKEAKDTTNPAFEEKAIVPVIKAKGFLEGVDSGTLPPLKGRTATVLKDGATELLATKDNDPLLTFWPAGAGRTAMFASDVKDRWASDWVKWRGYAPFFASVVSAIARPRQDAQGLTVNAGPARNGARTLDITLELRSDAGGYKDLASPLVTVRSGSGERRDMFMKQRAPGLYAATAIVDADQPETVTVDGAGDATGAMRVVAVDPSAEYRWATPDETRLRSIAAGTGGAWKPTPADILKPVAATPSTHRALWPWFVGLALGLWLVDIWLRRVRLFERTAAPAV